MPTYRPPVSVLDRLTVLSEQVDSIVVVDDGSPDSANTVLASIERAGYEVLRGQHNRGIAAALNTGIRLALDRGAEYVLTLDQDSVLSAGYVDACLAGFAISGSSTRLGIVCSASISGHPSLSSEYTPEGLGLLRVAIQSGFVISAQCLRDCGLFDESLVIDYVDTEYCLRMAAKGYFVAAAPGTEIEHELGELTPLRPFGIRLRVKGKPRSYEAHTPYRRYFITRNGIDVSFRYLRHNPRWVLSNLRQEWKPFIYALTSGPHRVRQLLAVLAGTVHGLIRKRGTIPPRLAKALTP